MVVASAHTTLSIPPVEDVTESIEDETTGAMLELPRGVGMLVIRRGPSTGVRYVLDSEVTRAGRHPESDIFLDDITVSRRHAEFITREGATSVRDVGSLNGTYVNRERIEEARISSGDEVQIGKFKLLYLLAGGE
jgi:pSer/pThr/pTyr-binding forkhead associated (FHA) protein